MRVCGSHVATQTVAAPGCHLFAGGHKMCQFAAGHSVAPADERPHITAFLAAPRSNR
jgi:hypothetical protein